MTMVVQQKGEVMTIIVSGGGTGGHITPILAVASKLKKLDPNCRIIYVGEKKGKFLDMVEGSKTIDEIRTIYAGKFRRYHKENWFNRIIDFRTIALNIRDMFFMLIGICQAIKIVRELQPNVVFLKGGFVGVPVGLASALCKVPFVTHDSDAIPGLANRMVSRWASVHATAMPAEYYSYPRESTRYIGVLVGDDYRLVTKELKDSYRQELKIPVKSLVLLVTGGSIGAQRINSEMMKIIPRLLLDYPNLYIIHQVGKGNLKIYRNIEKNNRVMPIEFMSSMYQYTGSADVVITRAGANTLAELGIQSKACVVVPNPDLTGGHQLVNADYLLQNHSVKVVQESEFEHPTKGLDTTVRQLLDYDNIREVLGKELRSLTKKKAAQELAKIIINTAKDNDAI